MVACNMHQENCRNASAMNEDERCKRTLRTVTKLKDTHSARDAYDGRDFRGTYSSTRTKASSTVSEGELLTKPDSGPVALD